MDDFKIDAFVIGSKTEIGEALIDQLKVHPNINDIITFDYDSSLTKEVNLNLLEDKIKLNLAEVYFFCDPKSYNQSLYSVIPVMRNSVEIRIIDFSLINATKAVTFSAATPDCFKYFIKENSYEYNNDDSMFYASPSPIAFGIITALSPYSDCLIHPKELTTYMPKVIALVPRPTECPKSVTIDMARKNDSLFEIDNYLERLIRSNGFNHKVKTNILVVNQDRPRGTQIIYQRSNSGNTKNIPTLDLYKSYYLTDDSVIVTNKTISFNEVIDTPYIYISIKEDEHGLNVIITYDELFRGSSTNGILAMNFAFNFYEYQGLPILPKTKDDE